MHHAQLKFMSQCADLNRYSIHPTKTKMSSLNSTEPPKLLLNRQDNNMTSISTIEKRISSARATAYSLMGAGLHGINGLYPNAARSLIWAFVLPRLLQDLEARVLTNKHLQRISQFFKELIKQI